MLKGFENCAEAVRGLVTVIMWQIHGFRAKLVDRARASEMMPVVHDQEGMSDSMAGGRWSERLFGSEFQCVKQDETVKSLSSENSDRG